MRIHGTKARPDTNLHRDEYVCQRCGIQRTFNQGRETKPDLCRDCKDVLALEVAA